MRSVEEVNTSVIGHMRDMIDSCENLIQSHPDTSVLQITHCSHIHNVSVSVSQICVLRVILIAVLSCAILPVRV